MDNLNQQPTFNFESRLSRNEEAIINLSKNFDKYQETFKNELELIHKRINDNQHDLIEQIKDNNNKLSVQLDIMNNRFMNMGKVDWKLASTITSIIFSMIIAFGGWAMHNQQKQAVIDTTLTLLREHVNSHIEYDNKLDLNNQFVALKKDVEYQQKTINSLISNKP